MSLLYLLPSLPMLEFDTTPGITPEAFAATCREQLSAADAVAAEALLEGRAAEHPFVEAWHDKEAILRNAVARQRARVAGTEAARWQRHTRGCDMQIEVGVDDAFLETDPIKKEKALDKIRWVAAEELQGPDPLNIKAVFAYAVKLAILSRWHALSATRGQETFETLTRTPSPLSTGE